MNTNVKFRRFGFRSWRYAHLLMLKSVLERLMEEYQNLYPEGSVSLHEDMIINQQTGEDILETTFIISFFNDGDEAEFILKESLQ